MAPERTIGTDAAQLQDLAVDTTGGIFAIVNGRLLSIQPGGNPDARHDVPVSTPTQSLTHAIFDARGRLYYSDSTENVMLSAPAASAPYHKILNTGGSDNYLALDGDGRLYVGVNGGVVLILSGATRGTPAISKLVGQHTSTRTEYTEQIEGLSTDSSGKLYVSNCASDSTASVLVFAHGARADAAPIATLAGARTGLTCSFPGR